MLEADEVVAGLGIEPNVELAAAAGIAVDGGIVVDEYGRVGRARRGVRGGRCRAFPEPALGELVRVEHEDHANTHGRVGRRERGRGRGALRPPAVLLFRSLRLRLRGGRCGRRARGDARALDGARKKGVVAYVDDARQAARLPALGHLRPGRRRDASSSGPALRSTRTRLPRSQADEGDQASSALRAASSRSRSRDPAGGVRRPAQRDALEADVDVRMVVLGLRERRRRVRRRRSPRGIRRRRTPASARSRPRSSLPERSRPPVCRMAAGSSGARASGGRAPSCSASGCSGRSRISSCSYSPRFASRRRPSSSPPRHRARSRPSSSRTAHLVLAALLLQLKTVLDNADGQLARLPGESPCSAATSTPSRTCSSTRPCSRRSARSPAARSRARRVRRA